MSDEARYWDDERTWRDAPEYGGTDLTQESAWMSEERAVALAERLLRESGRRERCTYCQLDVPLVDHAGRCSACAAESRKRAKGRAS